MNPKPFGLAKGLFNGGSASYMGPNVCEEKESRL